MDVISLHAVSKSIRGNAIFENASATFSEGRAYGIVGPNGSGKSVLFKLICGFLLPSAGRIEIAPKYKDDGDRFPNNFGIVIDRPAYHPDLTAMDNLRRLAAINSTIGDSEITTALDAVGLAANTRQKARNFSLGMKQKLGLAQAIMENQQVLLLDEPFNALDEDSVERIRTLLAAAKGEGKTIIFTSHNSDDINLLADSVYRINNLALQPIS
jgi:ABC-2 type transport system ATP-binding protein